MKCAITSAAVSACWLRLTVVNRPPPASANGSRSDFQLIADTNRDLGQAVAARVFREDLYARLNLRTFSLPGLADRHEVFRQKVARVVGSGGCIDRPLRMPVTTPKYLTLLRRGLITSLFSA